MEKKPIKRLIKNGDIILDGTLPRYEKEAQAFKKLEIIENLIEEFEIKGLFELRRALRRYKDTNYVRHTKNKALEREVLSLIASGHTRIFRRPPNHFCPYSDPCVEVRIIIEHDVENRNPEVLEWFKEKARRDEKQLLKDLMEMKL